MWARCEDDVVYREKVLALCEVDPRFWIDHFCWTYDDRQSEDEPLCLYPFQVEKIVEPYQEMLKTKGRERYSQIVLKSRGVGYTWAELALRTHSFLFRQSWSILIGSVTKEDVDDGGLDATHQSLFGKIRYIIDHLPRWMRDKLLGPEFKRDVNNHRLMLKNPMRPKNIIVGRQFSGMFARSMRFSEVWGDEIAWADAMQDADKALKQATNRFSGGSTPRGKNTFHHQLFTGEMKAVRITIHWSEHPELDVAWYNDQREHMTDEVIASELDCSFEGSAGGRVLGEVQISTHFNAWGPEGKDGEPREDLAEYVESLPLQVIIDPGISDDMAAVWGQWDERQGQGRVVDFVQTRDRAIDWIVPFILGEIPSETVDGDPWPHDYNQVELAIIARHKRWRSPEEVFGDHYGTTRSVATGFSAYDLLARYGIGVCPVRVEDDVQALIHLRLVLRNVRFAHRLIDQRNGPPDFCPTLGEVVTQWRYPRRKVGDYRENLKPVKDQYDHGGDCLKMWADTIALPEPRMQPVPSGRAFQGRPSDVSGGPTRWRRRR